MSSPPRRIAEHLHGLAAGGLAVLAGFLLLTIPLALVDMVRTGVTTSNLTLPLLFAGLTLAAYFEARRWHGRLQLRLAPA